MIGDSTPDRPYAQHMELVRRHRPGTRRAVVEGISLIALSRADGDRHAPPGCRPRDQAGDDPTKTDRFHGPPETAHERGFVPERAVFDGRYGSLGSLIRLTRSKADRSGNPDRSGSRRRYLKLQAIMDDAKF